MQRTDHVIRAVCGISKKEQERGARLGDSLRLYGGAYASPYYGAYGSAYGSYYGAYAASPYYSYGAYASPYYSAYSHPYSYGAWGGYAGYGGYGYGRGYYY